MAGIRKVRRSFTSYAAQSAKAGTSSPGNADVAAGWALGNPRSRRARNPGRRITQSHGQGAGLMTLNLDPPYPVSNLRVISHHLKKTRRCVLFESARAR